MEGVNQGRGKERCSEEGAEVERGKKLDGMSYLS